MPASHVCRPVLVFICSARPYLLPPTNERSGIFELVRRATTGLRKRRVEGDLTRRLVVFRLQLGVGPELVDRCLFFQRRAERRGSMRAHIRHVAGWARRHERPGGLPMPA